MTLNRLLSLLATMAIIYRIAELSDWQETLVTMVSLLIMLSMIWRGDLWAKFVLPMGFWESKALDFKKSDTQGAVMTVFGWVLLLTFLFMAYF